jgi:hypothetical protein
MNLFFGFQDKGLSEDFSACGQAGANAYLRGPEK